MVKPTLIEWNAAELKYYPFMIILAKGTASRNALSPKTWVPKETKNINVKVFSIRQTKMKLKQWQNTFHVIVNANLLLENVIQIKTRIIKHANVGVKIIVPAKNIIVGILEHVSVCKYLKSIGDTSLIGYN